MTVIFAVWVALVCTGVFAYFRHVAGHRAERRLATAARDIASDLDATAARLGAAGMSLPEVVSLLKEEALENGRHSDLAQMAVDPQGRVAWHSAGPVPPWPARDDHWRVAAMPAGDYLIVVGLDWRQTEAELREQAVALILLGILTVASAAFGFWVLVGRTLRPIRLLSRHARGASADELHVRLLAPSNDAEITELVETLNGLLERLTRTAAAKGRFYAAASHELRTPLQALSGHLEVALSRPRREAEYRAAIGEALTQTRRLTRLAQDLLTLHQLESTEPGQSAEWVDLAEVCERTVRQVQPLIVQRGLQLSTELAASAAVLAPPAHVDVLARNLIENAVRYATPGGEVRLALQAHDGAAALSVYNTCPPVADWNPAALLEAFARGDRARSSATGGNGLGLAICSAIARTNDWMLTLDHDGRGVLATVVFSRDDTSREAARGLARRHQGAAAADARARSAERSEEGAGREAGAGAAGGRPGA